jgi:LysR family transcriptional regulator, benzoate and cis,cis-muconate-responsive activator of ben and cat genes
LTRARHRIFLYLCGDNLVELKQLRAFVTLAEIGNIRRAASLLALSQPALSVRIQRLEGDVGYPLFERQARGVSLTERGARWLPHVKKLLAGAAQAEEAARMIGRGAFERLEIGVTPIAALSFVPDALRVFSAMQPGTSIALTENLSNELEEAVAHRRLDLAIVHPPSSRPAPRPPAGAGVGAARRRPAGRNADRRAARHRTDGL